MNIMSPFLSKLDCFEYSYLQAKPRITKIIIQFNFKADEFM